VEGPLRWRMTLLQSPDFAATFKPNQSFAHILNDQALKKALSCLSRPKLSSQALRPLELPCWSS
jgi:hypothetical protein